MFAECLAVGLACGDQCWLRGSGSALEALCDDALYKSTYFAVSFFYLDVCHYEQMVAPSGEHLRGEERYGVYAVRLCDPYLSALETVSRLGTMQCTPLPRYFFMTRRWSSARRLLMCVVRWGSEAVRGVRSSIQHPTCWAVRPTSTRTDSETTATHLYVSRSWDRLQLSDVLGTWWVSSHGISFCGLWRLVIVQGG